jgi:hypothetical protein
MKQLRLLKDLGLSFIFLALYACDSEDTVRQFQNIVDLQVDLQVDPQVDLQVDPQVDLQVDSDMDSVTDQMHVMINDQSMNSIDSQLIDQNLMDLSTDQHLSNMNDQDVQDDQSLDDMYTNADQDQSTNMEMTHQRVIHFHANLVQGAVRQSSANTIIYGSISSGASLSQSARYHVRSIVNP